MKAVEDCAVEDVSKSCLEKHQPQGNWKWWVLVKRAALWCHCCCQLADSLPKALGLSLCDKIPLLIPADNHQLCFQALAAESCNSTEGPLWLEAQVPLGSTNQMWNLSERREGKKEKQVRLPWSAFQTFPTLGAYKTRINTALLILLTSKSEGHWLPGSQGWQSHYLLLTWWKWA